jgi:long-chain acyl-CoA synthetase
MTTCFVTTNHITALVEKMKSGTLAQVKNLVIMDTNNLTDELVSTLENVTYYTFFDV